MDALRLKYEIMHKGLTIEEYCKAIGISKSAFYRKCNGTSEFTLGEIRKTLELLELDSPMGIFL